MPPSAAPRLLRPLHSFRNYPGEPLLHRPYAGAPGTTDFWPCKESLVAVDGTLWMNGCLVYYRNGNGVRIDPAWIRVVRIDRPDAYAGGTPNVGALCLLLLFARLYTLLRGHVCATCMVCNSILILYLYLYLSILYIYIYISVIKRQNFSSFFITIFFYGLS